MYHSTICTYRYVPDICTPICLGHKYNIKKKLPLFPFWSWDTFLFLHLNIRILRTLRLTLAVGFQAFGPELTITSSASLILNLLDWNWSTQPTQGLPNFQTTLSFIITWSDSANKSTHPFIYICLLICLFRYIYPTGSEEPWLTHRRINKKAFLLVLDHT